MTEPSSVMLQSLTSDGSVMLELLLVVTCYTAISILLSTHFQDTHTHVHKLSTILHVVQGVDQPQHISSTYMYMIHNKVCVHLYMCVIT